MDYKTHPITREELRIVAKGVREAFKCKNKYRFNVIDAFERISLVFPQIICAVVDNDEFEPSVPGRCIPDMSGNYLIEIKNSIYDGAAKGVGGYRDHIMHEISHAILCLLGFTPILDRSFKNGELRPYESMEWQAKALCGEIMIPYEATAGLPINKIIGYCKVSRSCAELRFNEFRKKRE